MAVAVDKSVPVGHVGKLEPNYYCRGWNPRRKKYCKSRAGTGTDHPGEGRCKLHGGNTDIIHGLARRYSGVKTERIRDLIAQHANDPDPLDILPEIAAARALFQDFIERYEDNSRALIAWHESYISDKAVNPKPVQVLDIADAYRILDTVSRMVERVEKVRAANAISRPDLNRIMNEMGRAVLLNVVEEETRKRIHDAWLAIPL